MRNFLWRTALVLLTLSPMSLFAGGDSLMDKQTLTFYLENDLFVRTDRYYTNGMRLTWLSPDAEFLQEAYPTLLPDPVIAFRDMVDQTLLHLGVDDEATPYTHNLGLGIGQSIYTPEDYSTKEPQPDDRPYAGWTYLSLSLQRKNATKLHVLDLSLGIVGDYSFAQETQNGVHDIRGFEKAQGWKNQLDNEPGLILTYEQRRRYELPEVVEVLDMDFIPYGNVSVGNVKTQAVLGGTLRAGYNIPKDFHSSRIRVGGYAIGPGATEEEKRGVLPGKFGIWLFGGLEGKAVARDIFLDGNTFSDSASVDKEPFVASFEVGVGMRYGDVRATATLVTMTPEFDGQENGQQYGSLSISYSF